MTKDIIFSGIENYVLLTLVYYTCSSKPIAMHVDDCFKFKRCDTLERYNQENFVSNTFVIFKNIELNKLILK